MEIIFLGTSSGTPTKTRNVSATVIKHRDKKSWCLVDCGEGTQHQLLQTKLALKHLAGIMITHVHGDHCFGLPGLLASAAMAGRVEPLTLVAPPAIKNYIETAQKISDTFLTYAIDFVDVSDLSGTVVLSDFNVLAHGLSHRVPSWAYQFLELNVDQALDTEKLHQEAIAPGPLWGQLQQGKDVILATGEVLRAQDYLLAARKPRCVLVGGDNDTPELLQDVIAEVDVLIHESTYTDAVAQKVGPGPQHSSARKVAQFAQNSNVNNLILTHFSARYQYGTGQTASISEIAEEAKKYYQGQLFLANDFDHYYLSKEGQLQLTAALPR